MPNIALKNLSIDIKKKELQSAFLILKHSFMVSHSFINTFSGLRQGKQGPCLDKEQDLLRAMLIFSASGLDSMIKQLIKDALELVIENCPGTSTEFEKFTIRKLKQRTSEDGNDALDIKFLSKILVSSNSKYEILQQYKDELCSGSLQSGETILKVGACFDIASKNLSDDFQKLKEAFDVRNLIIHEMDIDLSQPSKKTRFQRRRGDMIKYTNTILETAEKFLFSVSEKVKEKS